MPRRLRTLAGMGTFLKVLVSTWDGGLLGVRDGDITREIAASNVMGLTSDGAGGALAIVDGTSLQRRAPDGTWSVVATAPGGLSACAAANGGRDVFVGTDDARVLQLRPDGTLTVLEAFASVPGRETWYAGTAVVDGRVVGPPLGVRSMCTTCDGAALLVNVHVGGIPRSADGGASWVPTIDVEADVHEVAAHPSRPEIVAAATAIGLAISRDGGVTWSIEDQGLHARHGLAVAFVGDDVLFSTATDPFTSDGAIYRRAIDGRGPLRHVDGEAAAWLKGRGSVDTRGIAASGDVVAAAAKNGSVYLSRDRGVTWEQIAKGLPFPTGVLLVDAAT